MQKYETQQHALCEQHNLLQQTVDMFTVPIEDSLSPHVTSLSSTCPSKFHPRLDGGRKPSQCDSPFSLNRSQDEAATRPLLHQVCAAHPDTEQLQVKPSQQRKWTSIPQSHLRLCHLRKHVAVLGFRYLVA